MTKAEVEFWGDACDEVLEFWSGSRNGVGDLLKIEQLKMFQCPNNRAFFDAWRVQRTNIHSGHTADLRMTGRRCTLFSTLQESPDHAAQLHLHTRTVRCPRKCSRRRQQQSADDNIDATRVDSSPSHLSAQNSLQSSSRVSQQKPPFFSNFTFPQARPTSSRNNRRPICPVDCCFVSSLTVLRQTNTGISEFALVKSE